MSDAELIQWMNAELRKEPDYADCHFDAPIHRLKVNDADGCNWSAPTLRGSGIPVAVCKERAAEVLERARRMFNVK